MFRFYDRYICLFLEFIICTECITHLLMGEVNWITSSIPLWQDVMVGRHILDRLQSRLEQALQRLLGPGLSRVHMHEWNDSDYVTLCSHRFHTGGKLNGVCAMWLGYSVPRFWKTYNSHGKPPGWSNIYSQFRHLCILCHSPGCNSGFHLVSFLFLVFPSTKGKGWYAALTHLFPICSYYFHV